MSDKSLCRIGVFYDGSYFTYARQYYYFQRKIGWLDFRPLHGLIESYVRNLEQGYNHYRIVYSSWFQGMYSAGQSDDRQLRTARNLHQDLMHAGIEPKYTPMPQSGVNEKGADVALAVDAVEVGIAGEIDIAVLVTGDGDFVPLARSLMKHGVRVLAAYFVYDEGEHKSFINERLLNVCNYGLNITDMEKDKDFKVIFKGLFRKPDEKKDKE